MMRCASDGGVGRLGDRRPAGWRTRRRPCARSCRSRAPARAGGRPPSFSSLSPAGWPSVSLTFLKWSRSSRWTATISPRLTRVSACSSRSLSSTRLAQAGQRIVQRHVRDLGLRAAPLGDVHVGGDEAAVVERHAAHLQHRAVRTRSRSSRIGLPVSTIAMRLATCSSTSPGPYSPRLRVVAEQVLDRRRAVGEQRVRQVEQLLGLLVADHDAQVAVEEGRCPPGKLSMMVCSRTSAR